LQIKKTDMSNSEEEKVKNSHKSRNTRGPSQSFLQSTRTPNQISSQTIGEKNVSREEGGKLKIEGRDGSFGLIIGLSSR